MVSEFLEIGVEGGGPFEEEALAEIEAGFFAVPEFWFFDFECDGSVAFGSQLMVL